MDGDTLPLLGNSHNSRWRPSIPLLFNALCHMTVMSYKTHPNLSIKYFLLFIILNWSLFKMKMTDDTLSLLGNSHNSRWHPFDIIRVQYIVPYD